MFPLEDPFFLVLFRVILGEAKDPIKVPGIAADCSLVRDDGQKGFHLAITDCSALWLKTCPRHFFLTRRAPWGKLREAVMRGKAETSHPPLTGRLLPGEKA